MKHINGLIRFATATILCILIGGCQNGVDTVRSSTQVTLAPTIHPTSTRELQPTRTIEPVTPTLVPIPTMTITAATATITPSLTPSLTPLPTIPPEEVQALLQDLFLNNRGCRLPCWWGITPGVTRWGEARQFLRSFTSDFYHSQSSNPPFYDVDFGMSQEGYYFSSILIYYRDGIITSIMIDSLSTHLGYQLNQVLSNYGEPDDVTIFTYPNYLSHGQLPVYVILHYTEENTIVHYEFSGEIVGGEVRACLGLQPVGPRLFLGEVQDPMELLIITEQAPSIEYATGMSVAEFYEAFRSADVTICLETPVSIWGWDGPVTPTP